MSALVLKSKKQNDENLKNYSALVSRVRKTIAAGKERAFRAVERESVRTKWQVGKLIVEHVLLNQDRAGYGAQVLKKLSQDLGVSHSELAYMVEFARAYPIFQTSGKLGWGQIQSLLSVNEPSEREKLSKHITRKKLTVKQTRAEVRKLKIKKNVILTKESAPNPLQAVPGKIGAVQVLDWQGGRYYDLGFSTYLETKKRGALATNPPAEDLYTYNAVVEEVIDGDTLWANIALGFGVWTRQKLRLRGIDAPEMISRAGVEAKKFVEKMIKGRKSAVVIRTHKSDKYDRYLADIWAGNTYLNQALLDKRLAERVEE